MTEEEKKVVLKLNDIIYRVDNKYKLEITNSKILKDISNLIEKQQKEIEALKEHLEKESSIWAKIEKENNYISKDKIKDNIKELEILKMTSFANNEISKQVYKEQIDLINMQINVLKSLLEE